MREWAAEVTVDADMARRLIGEQFPSVALEPFTLLGEGWDNTVYLAGGRWAPRRPDEPGRHGDPRGQDRGVRGRPRGGGLWRAPRSVTGLLAAAAGLPRPDSVSVCHGDLHMRHLLVDDSGALAGVIDFGDVCVGDPAVDLSLLWSLLPPAGRADFLDEYGPLRDDQLLRARVLAINLCAILALYGHHEGMAAVEREALAGLDRASR